MICFEIVYFNGDVICFYGVENFFKFFGYIVEINCFEQFEVYGFWFDI